MRPKMVNDTCTSLDFAVHVMGEEQIKKMADRLVMPSVCPKPGCNGRRFIRIEDGYQCLNCFKIIYQRDAPKPNIEWRLF